MVEDLTRVHASSQQNFAHGERSLARFAPWLSILLLAATVEYARPFFENQNQYFVHAVEFPELAQDWLRNTIDPYPAFTWLAGVLRSISPSFGPVALAYLLNVVALAAVYSIARTLSIRRGENDPRIALLATIFIAASLVVVPGEIPVFWNSLFNGLGGQSIVNKPSYLQPSAAGTLLLFAFYLVLLRDESRAISWPSFLSAVLLTILACVLHPTYIVSAAIGFGLIALLRMVLNRQNRFPHFLVFGLLLVALVTMANPAVLQIGIASSAYEAALERFAYERIPWHTLWWQWKPIDLVFVGIVALASLIAWKHYRDSILGIWLLAVLAISLAFAVVLPLLPSPKFVLMFPWRISVLAVPIASAILAREVAAWATKRWSIATWHMVAVAGGLALVGLTGTARNWNATDRHSAVVLLRDARPSGVGVIPVTLQQIRLGVPAPIYVDNKSPPYASSDLIAWWRRIDQIKALYDNPRLFCMAAFEERIDWVMLPSATAELPCPARWVRNASDDEWTLYRRTARR